MPIPGEAEYVADVNLLRTQREAAAKENVGKMQTEATQAVGLANVAQQAEKAKLAVQESRANRFGAQLASRAGELGDVNQQVLAGVAKMPEPIEIIRGHPRHGGAITYQMPTGGEGLTQEFATPLRAKQAAFQMTPEGAKTYGPTGAELEKVKGMADPRRILYETEAGMAQDVKNQNTYQNYVKSLGNPDADPILKMLSGHFTGVAMGNAAKKIMGDPTAAYDQLKNAYGVIKWGSDVNQLMPALERYASLSNQDVKAVKEKAAKMLGPIKAGKFDINTLLETAKFLQEVQTPQGRAPGQVGGGVVEPQGAGAVRLPTLQEYQAATPEQRRAMEGRISAIRQREEDLDALKFGRRLAFDEPYWGVFTTKRAEQAEAARWRAGAPEANKAYYSRVLQEEEAKKKKE